MDYLAELTGPYAAQNLRTAFGSLEVLRSLDEETLATVVDQETARKIVAAFGLVRSTSHEIRLESPSMAGELFRKIFELFDNPLQEQMVVLPLSTRNEPLRSGVKVYTGTLNTIQVRIAELLRPAILINAQAMMLAHNHPSGDPEPSPEDISVTRHLYEAAKMMDIELLDHIIVGDRHFVSLKQRHLFP